MRRYNLALACAHTSKGYHYGIPATRDEIGKRCSGTFSNALLDLPPSAFNETIGVLASLAEQARGRCFVAAAALWGKGGIHPHRAWAVALEAEQRLELEHTAAPLATTAPSPD